MKYTVALKKSMQGPTLMSHPLFLIIGMVELLYFVGLVLVLVAKSQSYKID